ncbi:unnamed protein product [Phytophthora lilii]|uniref:Unnamed protein product n=1 Tax=Phytophthora lilii TaxID=2077276 RepID=A0A9W6TDW9_9STRA|nr:unnamed protein product [Phytophthora lilii]
MSLTSRPDTARFMAHVLTSFAPEDLEWKKFQIEGDRKSPLQIKKIAEKKLQKPINAEFVDYQENTALAMKDFAAIMGKTVEDGIAVAGTPEEVKETIAKYFPDWNPSPVDAFIKA